MEVFRESFCILLWLLDRDDLLEILDEWEHTESYDLFNARLE